MENFVSATDLSSPVDYQIECILFEPNSVVYQSKECNQIFNQAKNKVGLAFCRFTLDLDFKEAKMLKSDLIETGFANHEDYQIDCMLLESESVLSNHKEYTQIVK